MIRYFKLFDMLNRRGMKKTDLLAVISAPTLAKLSKGRTIQTDILDNICKYLKCQPGDIMEYINEDDDEEIESMIDRIEDMAKKRGDKPGHYLG